jgi:hypothetical protein
MINSTELKGKFLVMGFATNQTESSIRIFCYSLRSVYSCDECDIIIVTNRHEPYFRDLAAKGVRFESTPSNYSKRVAWPSKISNRIILNIFRVLNLINGHKWLPEIADAYKLLIETWHHPFLARWFAYQRILTVNNIYEKIFLADVKDVVFQAPFFQTKDDNRVTLFADANLFGKCHWNDKWYVDAYGKAAFNLIVDHQTVCAGTVLATQQKMLDMIEEFTSFVARSPFGKIDQTIFNHMLYTGKFKTEFEITPNITGTVVTLGSEIIYASLEIIDRVICRTSDKSVVPVVHMYDRFSDTCVLCEEKYAGKARKESPAVQTKTP